MRSEWEWNSEKYSNRLSNASNLTKKDFTRDSILSQNEGENLDFEDLMGKLFQDEFKDDLEIVRIRMKAQLSKCQNYNYFAWV